VSTSICDGFPAFANDETVCARIIAYDLAGNASVSNQTCTVLSSCGEAVVVDEEQGICGPNPGCEIIPQPQAPAPFEIKQDGCNTTRRGSTFVLFVVLAVIFWRRVAPTETITDS